MQPPTQIGRGYRKSACHREPPWTIARYVTVCNHQEILRIFFVNWTRTRCDVHDETYRRNGPCPSKANSGLPSCHIRAPPPPTIAADVPLSVARNTLLRASSSPPLHAPACSHSGARLVGVILNRCRASDSLPPPGTYVSEKGTYKETAFPTLQMMSENDPGSLGSQRRN